MDHGGIVHACPPDGTQLTPCCGETPFDLPRTDQITLDPALVTCGVKVETDEADEQAAAQMEAYARAWAQARAEEAAYIADRRSLAKAIVNGLNDTTIPLPGGLALPEGARFEWR